MNIIITILLVITGSIGLLLIIALFLKKEHYVKREIIIHAPRQQVFDFLKLLKNQDKFNKWAKADPNRNWEYEGTDGTAGFIISWSGNKKAGKGEKEIIKITEGKRIETQIRFIKPMEAVADVIMETEAVSEYQTKVALINSGTLKYPMNLFIQLLEKNFPKDMDESLAALKELLEKDEQQNKHT
ncbi:polyketide cyclase/dehydrase/lipid transport protein [Chryseobacterium sp. 52]|uniref:SRPBCC family protein n=1 Tax=Chryseobacterium sp. 52 TaxID=2035213 RepID=UPI000C18AA6F|nr:SRPBCC family protein [Chryseobacterium sp. 52]PIF45508.1 polyketide cyclase/dehydrase/lipid transport protein [Chryseobacterium sp. 52]